MICPAYCPTSTASELLAPQHEYTAAAALESQPNKWQARKCPAQCHFRIAHLDDQDAARIQMRRGLSQNDSDRVQAIRAGRQRQLRFVPVFVWQAVQLAPPHVRRIAHD